MSAPETVKQKSTNKGGYLVCGEERDKEFVVVARDGTVVERFPWTTPYAPESVKVAAFAAKRRLNDTGAHDEDCDCDYCAGGDRP